MKWQTLPGPANFFDSVVQQLRNGVSVLVAVSERGATGLEDAVYEPIKNNHWRVQRVTVDSQDDPLGWLTDQLYIKPEKWLTWNVEGLCQTLEGSQVVVIYGVNNSNWEAWRSFLREFEVASRQRPSDARPRLLLVVRGIAHKNLPLSGAALDVKTWSGILGELDTLTYIDQRLRSYRPPPKHHKLIVRQIAALALWDFDLADFLTSQPEGDIFDVIAILQAARKSLVPRDALMGTSWESGGRDSFDGAEMIHPFVLIELGDPEHELERRSWTAQAAELLPLIEMRRRELLKGFERQLVCPFRIDDRMVNSLHELEIGSLAYAAQRKGLTGALRDRAEWLARCRNTLAHLGLLSSTDARDARLHG
jgi:hypothetical protein